MSCALFKSHPFRQKICSPLWLANRRTGVCIGMYGAFLLERMHDEDMDDAYAKRQILQALVDEFEDYEQRARLSQ